MKLLNKLEQYKPITMKHHREILRAERQKYANDYNQLHKVHESRVTAYNDLQDQLLNETTLNGKLTGVVIILFILLAFVTPFACLYFLH